MESPRNSSKNRRSRGFFSSIRHGVWLVFLEASFIVLGLYVVFKNGGIAQSISNWLADPKFVPTEPIEAFGYSIRVKEPRSVVGTSVNDTCKSSPK